MHAELNCAHVGMQQDKLDCLPLPGGREKGVHDITPVLCGCGCGSGHDVLSSDRHLQQQLLQPMLRGVQVALHALQPAEVLVVLGLL